MGVYSCVVGICVYHVYFIYYFIVFFLYYFIVYVYVCVYAGACMYVCVYIYIYTLLGIDTKMYKGMGKCNSCYKKLNCVTKQRNERIKERYAQVGRIRTEEKGKGKESNNFMSTLVSQNLMTVSARKPLWRRHDNLTQLSLIRTYLLWQILCTLKNIY